MTEFHVGQKVVRIKTDYKPSTDPDAHKEIGDLCEVGVIYEVRWVGLKKFIDTDKEVVSIRLVGINRCTQHKTKPGNVSTDVPFGASGFRPLQENKIAEVASKTVEFFRKLAIDATQKKKVTVPND